MAFTNLLIALLAATVVVACSSDDDGDGSLTPNTSDPAQLVASSLAGTLALDSYRMELAYSPEDSELPPVVVYVDRGKYREVLVDAEVVIADGFRYTRECEDAGEACGIWTRQPEPFAEIAPSLGGLTGSSLETFPFTAVEVAENWQIAGADGDVQLFGTVDLTQAIETHLREISEAANLTAEEIDELITEQQSETSDRPTDCLIELTVSQDGLISKLEVYESHDDSNSFVSAWFSDFNNITVEPPTEFRSETAP